MTARCDVTAGPSYVFGKGLLLVAALCLPLGCGPGSGRLMTTVQQVRDLRLAEAERGYPVRLRGIATYYHYASKSLVLQDGSRGVFVDIGQTQVDVTPGREMEVEGITAAGESAPMIIATGLKDLTAGVMPAAERVSIRELSSGEYSYRRVEAQGIVRSGRRENDGRLMLNVATTDGVFQARLTATGAALTDAFVDKTVRIRGVADTTFNGRGEAIRLQVLVSSAADIDVVTASPTPATSASAQTVKPCSGRSATSAGSHLSEARLGYPVQLRAVVTTTTAVAANVFIQDSTAGIYMVKGGEPAGSRTDRGSRRSDGRRRFRARRRQGPRHGDRPKGPARAPCACL